LSVREDEEDAVEVAEGIDEIALSSAEEDDIELVELVCTFRSFSMEGIFVEGMIHDIFL